MVCFGVAWFADRGCLRTADLMNVFINAADPTRRAALDHLERIKSTLGRQYAAERNFDYGAGRHDSVTTLSPWIRHRLLLEEEAVAAALGTNGFSRSEKFIQEVFWRTYWKGWLEMRPQVWRDYTAAREASWHSWQGDDTYVRAISGETGIECFDAWVRELRQTNYLHNHARMWFASIWIFTLRLPWVLGADFFLQHLLDGDAASNTLSWRWVAGIQTRGKTYLARSENISRYTKGRFDPVGQLATSAVPIHAPIPPKPISLDFNTEPISGAPSLLLVTDDDLGLETANLPTVDLVGIASVNTADARSPRGISDGVASFVKDALNAAVDDFADKHQLIVEHIPMEHPKALPRLAEKMNAQQVIGLRNTVGPTKDTISTLIQNLIPQGVPYKEWVRPWDRTSWPYATHGFFKFKDSIPSILATLSLK